MRWYEETNFYCIELTNKRYENWWTTLSFEEAKEAIGKNAFINLSSGRDEDFKEAEYNTKVILTIKDYTEQERERLKRQDGIIERKMDMVKKIRAKRPSYFARQKIKRLDRSYKKKELSWYDRYMGAHIDPLLICHVEELEKVLSKCK